MRIKKRVWKKQVTTGLKRRGVREYRIPAPGYSLFRVFTADAKLYLGVPELDLAMALDRRGDLKRILGGGRDGASVMWLRLGARRVRISELGGAASCNAAGWGRAL